jgi:hypothetical protein
MEPPHLGQVDHAEAAPEAPGQVLSQVADQEFTVFGTFHATLLVGDDGPGLAYRA